MEWLLGLMAETRHRSGGSDVDLAQWHDEGRMEENAVFFEKKNQKTFDFRSLWRAV
jgi:hypothetical protein